MSEARGDSSRPRSSHRIGFEHVEVDPARLDDTELAHAVRRCGRLRGRVNAAQSKLIAEITKRKGAAEAEDLLRREQGISTREAKSASKLADTLDKHPDVADAVENGDITSEHAKHIGEAEDEHPGAADELLPKAKSQNADSFARTARNWRHHKSEEQGKSREQIQRDARKLSLYTRSEDGMGIVHAELDPVAFAKFKAALGAWNERLWRAGNSNSGPSLDMTPPRRLADALSAMADASVNGDGGPAQAQMVVIAQYDIIKRQLVDAHLADGTPLTPDVARRLACDADILPFVFAGANIALNAGRNRRLPSHTQRMAVIARDGGCRGENCTMSPEFCQIHHIEWWEHGGGTDINNLVMVCLKCHNGIHDGRLEVARASNGSLVIREVRHSAHPVSNGQPHRTIRDHIPDAPEPADHNVEDSQVQAEPTPRARPLFDLEHTAEARNAAATNSRSRQWSA